MSEQKPSETINGPPHQHMQPPEFKFVISEEEIDQRKHWLDLHLEDEELIRTELDPLLRDHVDELMDKMYEHFLTFEDTRSFFPNQHVLARAKATGTTFSSD